MKVLGWADGGWDPFPQPRKTLERLVNDTSSRNWYVENKYKHCRGLAMLEEIKGLLKANRQIILTGAPGTGKTYLARELAADLLGCSAADLKDREAFSFVQFHPAYDYTDFVEGLKPVQTNGSIAFELRSGIFREFCGRAKVEEEKKQPFVFVIDEINRADLSRVFGELFYALEPDYRGERGQVATQVLQPEEGV